ncbi:hemin import ATP-binding protein HmuV [Iodidimonas nitroreducens]|uniref:Hemin import ATP-binding protein HmuV n=1 Tax=Iodidimonas nitroreducens TaxID=1236968 RepID=A0A5A7N446_9PROT|nr:heme ABC transporter ATP-binding protein [Iodidimonas nitroreducens]GAK32454.1 hemin import ATP-binding protein HmuV [alpha proteobacterium Q-1]GER02777.1 hemin import ATP-binding protein HmuV [Iodidimonas nitroreducens]
MLMLDDVSFSRGDAPILDRVSLQIVPGRLTVLIGPNGAGKSTALRLLAGEIAPHRGSVSLGGRPLSAWNSRALSQCRAILPQSSDISFNFTVFDIAALGRLPHGERPASPHAQRIIWQALARTRVSHLADRPFPTLSGGERQRVQLARVLAQIWPESPPQAKNSPSYLLLDEPTSALDPGQQIALLSVAKDFAAQGYGVFAILHDLNQASAFADHLAILESGRLIAQGRPEKVLTRANIRDVWGMDVALLQPHGPGRPVIAPHYHPPSLKHERAMTLP